MAKEHPFSFTPEDLDYIRGFSLIYTNLNSYIEEDLPLLKETGVPIAYDFSLRWNDEYLAKVAPYVTVAILSCAHLTPEEREREIIVLRFGLQGRQEQTQKEVADKLGISQSYISRLEKRIIDRLKREILKMS